MVPRVAQVIEQTTRRVRHGETVPAPEKVVSLFEPHTAILRKGKPGKPGESGRVLWLEEVEGGIITRSRLLAGHPDEAAQVVPSVDAHIERFGHPPEVVVGDRGLHSATNDSAPQSLTSSTRSRPG
jgi:IS5 family transposase